MKIITNNKLLVNNIGTVKKIINKKVNMDTLKGIKLVAKNDSIIISSVNIDNNSYIEVEQYAEVIKEGEILINAETFETCVKNSDGDFIEIESIENNVFINGDTFRSKNQLLDLNNYTSLKQNDLKLVTTINISDLKDSIKKVIDASSNDKTRPVLNSVYMEVKKDNIIFTSIDGYRCATTKVYSQNEKESNYIISNKIMNVISKIKYKGEKDVEILVNEKYILFRIDNIDICSELITGDFIQYEKLFQKDYTTRITINTKTLLSNLKNFKSICKNEKNHLINLEIKDNEIILKDNDETSQVNLNCTKEGDDLDIGFNCTYLIEGLTNIKDYNVTILFTSQVNPTVICSVSTKYLLLPVRTQKR